jgi:cell division protein FtsW
MTLPFISYGGSSLLSLALGIGFLVAVMRKRPRSMLSLEPGHEHFARTFA